MNADAHRFARGFAVWAAGLAFAAILRLWAATWRADTRQLARLDAMLAAGDRVLAVFWHGEYFPLFALVTGRPALILAGRSFRGEVIGEICRRFGHTALLVEHRQHGFETIEATLSTTLPLAALALDGPLGPFHSVKPGAVRIASDLGYRILPVRAEGHPGLTLSRRWDRRFLPLPFAAVKLHVGEPLDVPAGLPRGAVEPWQAKLGERMDALDAQMTGTA